MNTFVWYSAKIRADAENCPSGSHRHTTQQNKTIDINKEIQMHKVQKKPKPKRNKKKIKNQNLIATESLLSPREPAAPQPTTITWTTPPIPKKKSRADILSKMKMAQSELKVVERAVIEEKQSPRDQLKIETDLQKVVYELLENEDLASGDGPTSISATKTEFDKTAIESSKFEKIVEVSTKLTEHRPIITSQVSETAVILGNRVESNPSELTPEKLTSGPEYLQESNPPNSPEIEEIIECQGISPKDFCESFQKTEKIVEVSTKLTEHTPIITSQVSETAVIWGNRVVSDPLQLKSEKLTSAPECIQGSDPPNSPEGEDLIIKRQGFSPKDFYDQKTEKFVEVSTGLTEHTPIITSQASETAVILENRVGSYPLEVKSEKLTGTTKCLQEPDNFDNPEGKQNIMEYQGITTNDVIAQTEALSFNLQLDSLNLLRPQLNHTETNYYLTKGQKKLQEAENIKHENTKDKNVKDETVDDDKNDHAEALTSAKLLDEGKCNDRYVGKGPPKQSNVEVFNIDQNQNSELTDDIPELKIEYGSPTSAIPPQTAEMAGTTNPTITTSTTMDNTAPANVAQQVQIQTDSYSTIQTMKAAKKVTDESITTTTKTIATKATTDSQEEQQLAELQQPQEPQLAVIVTMSHNIYMHLILAAFLFGFVLCLILMVRLGWCKI